jgi:phosphatidylserine decarboxylase
MAKNLEEWIEGDVRSLKEKGLRWLSEEYFFRDPVRPMISDPNYFFAPADGILLYLETVKPEDPIVEIKGKAYSLRDAMRDPAYSYPSMVASIFMTFFDVHVNRIPVAGRLCYRELEAIHTYNYPMLAVEKSVVQDLCINLDQASYLHSNQRMLNKIYSSELGQHYYVLQIADYDVDAITPFHLKQNRPFAQNQRFSQIRYGSQVDLIVPLIPGSGVELHFVPHLKPGMHVEAGVDPLIQIEYRQSRSTSKETSI